MMKLKYYALICIVFGTTGCALTAEDWKALGDAATQQIETQQKIDAMKRGTYNTGSSSSGSGNIFAHGHWHDSGMCHLNKKSCH